MASFWNNLEAARNLDREWGRLPAPVLVNDERYSTPGPNVPQSTAASSSSLSTDVATLHTINKHLQAELDAFKLLAATLARQLQDVRGPLTPAATATATAATATSPSATTTAPLTCPHANNPCTISSGRGAASLEVFQEIIKTNWHGRLGRTHMVDVDALPAAALTELDCFLPAEVARNLPQGPRKVGYNTDEIFASLAALGLRLEDRGPYADVALENDMLTLNKSSTIKRGRKTAVWFMTHEKYADYWEGSVMETMLELARYRGLFDDEGYLKE